MYWLSCIRGLDFKNACFCFFVVFFYKSVHSNNLSQIAPNRVPWKTKCQKWIYIHKNTEEHTFRHTKLTENGHTVTIVYPFGFEKWSTEMYTRWRLHIQPACVIRSVFFFPAHTQTEIYFIKAQNHSNTEMYFIDTQSLKHRNQLYRHNYSNTEIHFRDTRTQ